MDRSVRSIPKLDVPTLSAPSNLRFPQGDVDDVVFPDPGAQRRHSKKKNRSTQLVIPGLSPVIRTLRRLFLWRWWAGTLVVGGIALWGWSIPRIHPYSATETGLVSLLPGTWWIALVLMVIALASELSRKNPRIISTVLTIVGLALVLHGTLPASESAPRFGTAFDIAQFTEQLARTGHPTPLVDARFSWPGLFSAAGMASRAMGVSPLWFLRWAPLILNLAYLLPLKVIANVSLRSERARWLVLPLFLAGNWIDQDYFSPQGIDYFLYLVVIAVLLKSFSTRGAQPAIVQRITSSRQYIRSTSFLRTILMVPTGAFPAEVPLDSTSRTMSSALYGLILLFVGATVVSHQFTPIALCVVPFALAATGRTKMKTLWLITAVLTFGWLSWQGRVYWLGHLSRNFRGCGPSWGCRELQRWGSTSSCAVGTVTRTTRQDCCVDNHIPRRSLGVLVVMAPWSDPLDIGSSGGSTDNRCACYQLWW